MPSVYCRTYCGISLLSILFIHLYRAQAALVNRTIDDEYGDSLTGEKLAYFPSNASTWAQGRNCTDCLFYLDTSRTWNGTWHDATQQPDDPVVRSITAHFNGIAVYVYNVLASYTYGNNDRQRTVTYLTFELDGQAAGSFLHDGDGGARYDVPVYARGGLTDGPHTLVIRVPPGPTGNDRSVALFDYIEYTTNYDATPPTSGTTLPSDTDTPTRPSPSPSSSDSPHTSSVVSSDAHSTSSEPQSPSTKLPPAPNEATHALTPHTGAIAGGTVGAVLALVLGGVLVFLRRKNRRCTHRHVPALPPMEDTTPAATGNREGNAADNARIRALEEELAHMRALLEPPPRYEAAVVLRSSCAAECGRSV